jgi:hypothetical protein
MGGRCSEDQMAMAVQERRSEGRKSRMKVVRSGDKLGKKAWQRWLQSALR